MMKKEKLNLIIIFSLFFLLSATLFYIMMKKDLHTEQIQRESINMEDTRAENTWPKVEIKVRQ